MPLLYMQYTERTASDGALGGLSAGFKGQQEQGKKLKFLMTNLLDLHTSIKGIIVF